MRNDTQLRSKRCVSLRGISLRGGPFIALGAILLAACAPTQPTRNVVLASDAMRCTLAPAPPQAAIALTGLYEGEGVSSVAVNGLNNETRTASVEIEPGEQELYLVLVSLTSMVWRFRGATERVTAAALITNDGDERIPGVGATGLEPGKVRIFHARTCLPCWARAPRREEGVEYRTPFVPCQNLLGDTAEFVQNALGRAPDIVAGSEPDRFAALSLPSGRFRRIADEEQPAAPRGFHAESWEAALRFSPAGLVEIDPAEVVGAPAVRYDVLPREMGLAQLVGAGRLEYMGGFDTRAQGDYRIVRSIPHYPGNLRGVHRVRFLVEAGVPTPRGDPGDSCVIVKETGAISDNCNPSR